MPAQKQKLPGCIKKEPNDIILPRTLTLVSEFDKVIENGSKALRPGGRWVVADLKLPSNWLARLAPVFVLITRPFGVTIDLAERRLWESMESYLKKVNMEDVYGGLAYIAQGEHE